MEQEHQWTGTSIDGGYRRGAHLGCTVRPTITTLTLGIRRLLASTAITDEAFKSPECDQS